MNILTTLRAKARQRALQRELNARLAERRLIRTARSEAARRGAHTEIQRRARAARQLQQDGWLNGRGAPSP